MASSIIRSHTLAEARIEEARGARGHLTRRLGSLGTNTSFLPTFAALATDVAGVLLTVDGDPTEGVEWLRRSARVRALVFGRVAFPELAPPLEIAEGVTLGVLAQAPPWEAATAPSFVDAMWCAMAIGDATALSWLSNIPESVLLRVGVQVPEKFDEYFFPFCEALRAIVTKNGRHGAELIRTLEAMPMPDGGSAWSRCEQIDEPALRALFALLADEGGYDEALTQLFNQHRAHWETNGAPRGAISLPACALERLARSRAVPLRVASPYAPAEVWGRSA